MDFSQIKAVIFDVDGTLYNQACLRRRMLNQFAHHFFRHPSVWRELIILRAFRRIREKITYEAVDNIKKAQYVLCAKKTNRDIQHVIQVIHKWMYQAPLPHIVECRRPGVRRFFRELTRQGINIGILSDYPADQKIETLGLNAEIVICSSDQVINRLKPSPIGLLYIAEILRVPEVNCLVIGDRDDRDGEAARLAGMPYLIWENKYSGENNRFHSFLDLINNFRNRLKGKKSGL